MNGFCVKKKCVNVLMFLLGLTLHADSKWTMLNYMELNNNLFDAAGGVLHGMQAVGSTQDVNLFVQLDKPNDNNKANRFYVKKDSFVGVNADNTFMGIHPVDELLDAAQWAYRDHPSARQVLFLSNHGGGVIDVANGRGQDAHKR